MITPNSKKNLTLTIASFVFYGIWNYTLVLLLLFSISFNYIIGQCIHSSKRRSGGKVLLILSIITNLGLLGYFKYANFFIDSLKMFFPNIPIGSLQIVLPIGISFFTFQGMSYTFDIYRKQSFPVNSIIDFACYISMFPQLIAGPIVRYNQIEEQLYNRKHSVDKTYYGVRRFIVGLAKKVIIADSMAFIVQQHLYQESADGLSVWVGITAFSLQIFFDFSGYSDMAIGLGNIFGFKLPENFNRPYRARGIYDFWRRWHMTLSGWLRDYLYIPLGGSHCSAIRWVINISITFLLCGLWHGASWTYVIWGGYYGLLIILEYPFRQYIKHANRWIVISLTNILVIIGWVFFKAENIDQALLWLEKMFALKGVFFIYERLTWQIIAVTVLLIICWTNSNRLKLFSQVRWLHDVKLVILFFACCVTILGVSQSPFLYFQF